MAYGLQPDLWPTALPMIHSIAHGLQHCLWPTALPMAYSIAYGLQPGLLLPFFFATAETSFWDFTKVPQSVMRFSVGVKRSVGHCVYRCIAADIARSPPTTVIVLRRDSSTPAPHAPASVRACGRACGRAGGQAGGSAGVRAGACMPTGLEKKAVAHSVALSQAKHTSVKSRRAITTTTTITTSIYKSTTTATIKTSIYKSTMTTNDDELWVSTLRHRPNNRARLS